jgi:pimeloyl-ACP methyl ester carboxylesterase
MMAKTFFLLLMACSAFAHAESGFSDKSVSIVSSQGKQALNGFLTVPQGASSLPAVLILLGSGPGSTDNPTRDFNPFRDLAHRLADAGIVNLRFDKRGTGYNSAAGSFESQTLDDYYADADDALAHLAQAAGVDPSKIVVMGHSIGTIIATHLVAAHKLRGVVLSAGPSTSMLTVMEEQSQQYLHFSYPDDAAKVVTVLDVQLSPYKEIQNGTFNFSACDPYRCQTQGGIQILDGQNLLFWQQLFVAQTANYFPGMTKQTSVLCMGGGSDWIVAAYHAQANCDMAAKVGLSSTVQVIPDVDHFFSVAPSKEDSLRVFSSGSLNGLKLNDNYINAIVEWIVKLTSNGQGMPIEPTL